MDAKGTWRKKRSPRAETRPDEGRFGERNRARTPVTMTRLWKRIYRAMSGAYSDCAVHAGFGRAQKMPQRSLLKLQRTIEATTARYPFPDGCCGWLQSMHYVFAPRQRGLKVFVELRTETRSSRQPARAVSAGVSQQGREGCKRETIARLPENYRVPLVLRYYSELTYDEIAPAIGLGEDYVAGPDTSAKQELAPETVPRSNDHGMYSETACALFVDGNLLADEARRMRDHMARAVSAQLLTHCALRTRAEPKPERAFREAASPCFSRSLVRVCVTWR